MPFELASADRKALENVLIIVDGQNDNENITLDSNTLMFPPTITKDVKSARWHEEADSGSFEPFKFYKNGNARQLGVRFQWVTGGYNGGKYDPQNLHIILSRIKAYFYGPYFNSGKARYPVVTIHKLYNVILSNDKVGAPRPATFRMMSFNLKYSKEMTQVDSQWYPLHIEANMELESVSQLEGEDGSTGPFSGFPNLAARPVLEWF